MASQTNPDPVDAITAAATVAIRRDHRRNLLNTSDPEELAPTTLAEYRAFVSELVDAYIAAGGTVPQPRTSLHGGLPVSGGTR